MVYLPLVSREWKNGSNSSYNCTPFLHSLLTKGKFRGLRFGLRGLGCRLRACTMLATPGSHRLDIGVSEN